VEFRRERLEAEILDPRRSFERARLPVEIRWDPLLGHSCRLLPHSSLQPPAPIDLEELAKQSRPGCPFCAPGIEQQTPRFPPEVWPEGRIRRGEAVLFPNLVPYAKWSSVSVYSPHRHLLPLEEISTALLADNIRTQIVFMRAVLEHDSSAVWLSLNANQLPPSGSSIFHPHLQGSANPAPTTMQKLLAETAPGRIREYVESERRHGERYLGSVGGVEWLASFAPIGPAELRAFVFDAASLAELDDPLVTELARGLSLALHLYAELGFQSFNLAVHSATSGMGNDPLVLRMVARTYFGSLLRSDAMWSERLHWEAAVDLAPEAVAELGQTRFSRAA
jgi:galactose-1-phosphate uridylyltransferase